LNWAHCLELYLPAYTQTDTLDDIPFSLHVVRISLIVRKKNAHLSIPDSHILPWFHISIRGAVAVGHFHWESNRRNWCWRIKVRCHISTTPCFKLSVFLNSALYRLCTWQKYLLQNSVAPSPHSNNFLSFWASSSDSGPASSHGLVCLVVHLHRRDNPSNPHLVPGSFSWRIPLATQLIPGIILALGTIYLPPSPRLLVLQGRYDEALQSLARLRAVPGSQPGDVSPDSPNRLDPVLQVSLFLPLPLYAAP